MHQRGVDGLSRQLQGAYELKQPEIVKTIDLDNDCICYTVRVPTVWLAYHGSATFAAQVLRLCARALEDLEKETVRA